MDEKEKDAAEAFAIRRRAAWFDATRAVAAMPEGRARWDGALRQAIALDASRASPFAESEEGWRFAGPRGLSGRIKCLAIRPPAGREARDVLYAGSASGGIWRTGDAGAHWTNITDGAPAALRARVAVPGALAVDPNAPGTLYVATGEDADRSNCTYPGTGVFRTRDEGRHWEETDHFPGDRCGRILVDPKRPSRLFVASNAGLYASARYGARWTPLLSGHVSDAVLDPTNPDVVFAGVVGTGVFRSADGGNRWCLLSRGLPTGNAVAWVKMAMGRHGTHGTHLLFARVGSDLFRSTDGGRTWIQLPVEADSGVVTWCSLVAVSPHDARMVFSGGADSYRSEDGGASWPRTNRLMVPQEDHHALVFSPTAPAVCFLATDGGVFRSSNHGRDWVLTTGDLPTSQFYSIGASRSGSIVLGGTTQDQDIRLASRSATWDDSDPGQFQEGGFFVVDPDDGTRFYVCPFGQNVTIYIGGTAVEGKSREANVSLSDILDLAVQPGGTGRAICAGSNGVLFSDDHGLYWRRAPETAGRVTCVAYAPGTSGVCFAATDAGRVYRSTEGGSPGSWKTPYAAGGTPPPAGCVTSLAVSGGGRIVYATYGRWRVPHVVRSADGGHTWADASGRGNGRLPDAPASDVLIDPEDEHTVYVGTDVGVFRSRNAGATWEPFGQRMPAVPVVSLAFHPPSRQLFAGTMGRGVYARRIPASR
jgi:photosystem II stability/assembly factor-like uncharacterized protein